MSFDQFYREMKALMNPAKMQTDLREIEMRKTQQRTSQIRIDKAMEN